MNDDAAGIEGLDPIAAVQAWGAHGVRHSDPVKFSIVDALARRAAAQQGEARRLLIARLGELMVPPASAPAGSELRRVGLAALSELVDRLGRAPGPQVLAPSLPHADATQRTPTPRAPAPPATLTSLKAVTAFKGTWSRLRADQRLRQALAQVPAMAGPLNSSHLVNLTLQAMRDLSPAYLDAFMLHVDTLLWLEQASGAGDLAPRPATTPDGRRGPGARAARKA